MSTPVLTVEEVAAEQRIRELHNELEAQLLILRRPAEIVESEEVDDEVDNGAPLSVLACPFCGSDDLQYEEDIANYRDLCGIEADVLQIDGHYEVSDDGDNERLYCRTCMRESRIPDDLTIDWV